jgi:micrococcal nuclease
MRFLSMMIILVLLVAGCSTLPEEEFFSVPPQGSCKGEARCYFDNVTAIVDGDTIETERGSIRFALVDAPERNETGGSEARDFVLGICPVGSTVLIDEDDMQNESYGRIVAVVYCNDRNINAELLANNYATLYRYYCDRSEFADEEWTGC